MKSKPPEASVAYARTKTSCETCVRARVRGNNLIVSEDTAAAAELCKHLPDGDLPFDPKELGKLKILLGLESEVL